MLIASGRLDEAEPLFRRLIAYYARGDLPETFDLARALSGLANLLQNAGRIAETSTLRRRHVSPLKRLSDTRGSALRDLKRSVENYSSVLAAIGKSETEIAAAIDHALRDPRGAPPA